MLDRRTLRFRVSAAFLLAGALLSTLFAAGTYLVNERIEREHIQATVGEELGYYVAQRKVNAFAPAPNSAVMQTYVVSPTSSGDLPAYLSGLGPGFHDDIDHEGKEYHVAVRDEDGVRYLLAYDVSRLDRMEDHLYTALVAGALLFSYGSLWLGFWLSGRILDPLTRLAGRISEQTLGERGEPLAPQFAADEVGALAKAFDDYATRLRRFAERESAFAADVSHELRTPISAARVAVDLIRDEAGGASARVEQLVGRLERSMDQMGDLIDLFLLLAREDGPAAREASTACDVPSIVREAVDARAEKVEATGLKMALDIRGDLSVAVPRIVLSVLIGNMLDNAIANTVQGGISVTVDEAGVTVIDSGVGVDPSDRPHLFERGFRVREDTSGAGLGLAIVDRLCERYGWTVQLRPGEHVGTETRLFLEP